MAESSEHEESGDKKIPSDEHMKKYFRVDLMYCCTEQWPRKTCLYCSVAIDYPTRYSKCSQSKYFLYDNISNSNMWYNTFNQHAEEKMLKDLSDKYDTRLDKLSDELRYLNLSDKTAKQRSSYKDERVDEMSMKMNIEIIMNYSPCKPCADKIESYKKNIEKDCDVHITITIGSFYKLYPMDDKNNHIEGLANLLNAGIKLELIWDSEQLKSRIKELNIGTELERNAREEMDRVYMKLVIKRAKEIA